MSGRLFVVSLPIGNLADITLRAIETLRAVDFILAEDTRTTRRVLDRYEIRTPFYSSVYEGAEDGRTAQSVELLLSGKDLALVSDAGTPLVSDPGFPLVRSAVAAGIQIIPVPGPTAAMAALVASGLPPDRFVFLGSLPRKAGHRERLFARLRDESSTIVAYESPHRLQETLDLLARELPERDVVVARELTKIHEEFVRGSAAGRRRGLRRARRRAVESSSFSSQERPTTTVPADPARVAAVLAFAREQGLAKKETERLLVAALGVTRNRAYELAHRET